MFLTIHSRSHDDHRDISNRRKKKTTIFEHQWKINFSFNPTKQLSFPVNQTKEYKNILNFSSNNYIHLSPKKKKSPFTRYDRQNTINSGTNLYIYV